VVNLAVVGGLGGYVLFLVLRGLLRGGRGRLPLVAGLAAFSSVPLSAAAFTLEYAVGGAAPVDLADLATAMVGTHVLIGIGEGVLTACALGAVLAARPDLVHGARGLRAGARTPALPTGDERAAGAAPGVVEPVEAAS
jgi:cobalt/nickel transport system permease protein